MQNRKKRGEARLRICGSFNNLRYHPADMTEKLPVLTGLRGLAALVIVFYHYKVPGFGRGWLAVDVFFGLSGFVLSHVYRDGLSRGEFLWARFARTIPTHLVATSLVGCVLLTLHGSADFDVLFASLALAGLINPPIWSLIVEWYDYLIFAALGPLAVVRRAPAWLLIALGCIIGLIGILRCGNQPPLTIFHIMRGIGWYSAGIGLYRTGWRPRPSRLLDSRLALWLGAISYPLYLIHWLAAAMLKHIGVAAPYPAAAIGIPISVGLAVLLHHAVEMPAQRALRR